MMIMRLLPNVVTHLPLTAYYSMTLLSLYVGKTGIKNCTLKIGDQSIRFSQVDGADEATLAVDGDLANTPTHLLLRENESIKLELPDGTTSKADEELLLKHFLSYSVPRGDREHRPD